MDVVKGAHYHYFLISPHALATHDAFGEVPLHERIYIVYGGGTDYSIVVHKAHSGLRGEGP